MIEHAKLKICLVDHTKFGKTYFVKSCSFEDIDILITDKVPNDEFMEVINKSHVKLIVV